MPFHCYSSKMFTKNLLSLKTNRFLLQKWIFQIHNMSPCTMNAKLRIVNKENCKNSRKIGYNLKNDSFKNTISRVKIPLNNSVLANTSRFLSCTKSIFSNVCLISPRTCSTSTNCNNETSSEGRIIGNLSVESKKDQSRVLEHEIEHVDKLYPSPKNVLHNMYDLVAKDLNNHDLRLRPTYSVGRDKRNPNWSCTYTLKWPEVTKISAVAKTKQEASHKAALSVLLWLKRKGRISKDGQPIIVEPVEVKKIINQNLPELKLNQASIERIRAIVEEHKENFVGDLINDLNNKTTSDRTSFKEDDFDEPYDVYLNKVEPKMFAMNRYCAREKVDLPISSYKEEFMDLLKDNSVVIVKGEPGCGKSTRIPQYVLESWAKSGDFYEKKCRIAVTQPRRIAAISLAQRVAGERDETTGHIIGYQVRLKSQFNSTTGRILYCTTGILLRHLQSDPNLSNFSHVILDEAHERDVNTDLLMNLLRTSIKTNPHLKLIVMSATIDTNMFQRYFDGAPIMHVPGFTHPVRGTFLDDVDVDLSKTLKICESDAPSVVHEDVVKLIGYLHRTKGDGAILCFLPGWEDISKIDRAIPRRGDMSVLCLHSRLQDVEQHKIFTRPPPGVRKVILATNIAETSVTIDDVVYVIDTGIHKESRFDNEKGVNCIDNHWISKASMIQRRGRAGRCQPGECFHLYPKSKFANTFTEYSIPEILRTSLTKIVLNSKVYSNNMNALEFMSQLPCPPERLSIQRAVDELKDLELLDDQECLTPLGGTLANFQLEPKLSKAMVNAVVFKCVTPIVDIVTLFFSETELFTTGLVDKEGIKRIKKQHSSNSDHLALMRIFEKWLDFMENNDSFGAERFCHQSNLIQHKLITIEKLRKIHFDYLYNGLSKSLPISDNYSDNDELVKAILLSGVGTLLMHRTWDVVKGRLKNTNVLLTNNNHKATITSGSVNFKRSMFPSSYLLYINETRSNIRRTTIIRECSIISPLTVLLFSNKKLQKQIDDTNEEKVKLGLENTTVKFLCNKALAEDIIKCKDALNSAYQYYIYQMTKGGECNNKLNRSWDIILRNLNDLLLKNRV